MEEYEKSNSVVRNQRVVPEKLELAKYFRKNPTEEEEEVWKLLRNRRIKNLKWRRQQVIDGFIADFYCAELNAVLDRTYRLRNEYCDKQHLEDLIEIIIKDHH